MPDSAKELDGWTILIVEDDYFSALMLADLVERRGAVVVGPVGTLNEAMAIAIDDTLRIDLAILDVNLHGDESYPIADVLAGKGVKIIFGSGYDDIKLPYSHYPRCVKPFQLKDILQQLQKT